MTSSCLVAKSLALENAIAFYYSSPCHIKEPPQENRYECNQSSWGFLCVYSLLILVRRDFGDLTLRRHLVDCPDLGLAFLPPCSSLISKFIPFLPQLIYTIPLPHVPRAPCTRNWASHLGTAGNDSVEAALGICLKLYS